MRIITRTIYGGALQTTLLLGTKFELVPNTTLNEKFGVQPTATLPVGVIPKVNYFCVGNGGHRMTSGTDGIPYTTPINHRASDAALFNHIPFLIRELDDDISIAKRENYALRKIIDVEGIQYIAYYLKRMDTESVKIVLQHTNTTDGNTITTAYVPNNDNLNPTQPNLPNDGVITTDGNYLSSSAIITVIFDELDVAELVNVARVLYNNENRALISEIGLCSGLDLVVSTTGASGSFNYREAVAVQVVTHITGYYPVGMNNRGFELQIEAGATEPLLGVVG